MITGGDDGGGRLTASPETAAGVAAGASRALLPLALGGGEGEVPGVLDVLEELGARSGSTGWSAYAAVAGSLLAWELDDAAARTVYADPDHVVAYAGAPFGVIGGGTGALMLNGRWPMVTARSSARWFALGCRRLATDERATVAFVPAASCSFEAGPDLVGLRSTDSGPVIVEGAPVPEGMLLAPAATDADQYRARRRYLIPSLMASVSLGVANGALNATVEVLRRSAGGPGRVGSREQIHHALGEGHARLAAASAWHRATTVEVWQILEAEGTVDLVLGARLRLAATHAAMTAADVVTSSARLVGTAALGRGTRLADAVDDARTLACNVTVGASYYGVFGQVLVEGEPPGAWP